MHVGALGMMEVHAPDEQKRKRDHHHHPKDRSDAPCHGGERSKEPASSR